MYFNCAVHVLRSVNKLIKSLSKDMTRVNLDADLLEKLEK
jgi:hypothetical protein